MNVGMVRLVLGIDCRRRTFEKSQSGAENSGSEQALVIQSRRPAYERAVSSVFECAIGWE